jgi:hypothetical protein
MIRTHHHSHYNSSSGNLNMDHNNSDDFSEASEITYGTRTNNSHQHQYHPNPHEQSSSRGTITHHHGIVAGIVSRQPPPQQQQQRYEQDPPSSSNTGPQRATRMPFTDAYGDKGWYTGEVASGSGLPHGQGSMQYCDGRVRNGWWSNGLAAGGGGGGGSGGIRSNAPSPKIRTPTISRGAQPPPSSNESIGSRNTGHVLQYNHNLPPPPPPSRAQFTADGY